MERNILIAGKDFPDGRDFAEGLESSGRKIAAAAMESDSVADENKVESGILQIEWNKSSPVSARTLLLQAESAYRRLDEAVLYFDEEWFAGFSGKLDAQECAKSCDELILGYQYLTLEILDRFERKREGSEPGTLVFLLKETACAMDAVKFPSVRNGMNAIASPVVAAAAAAFTSFAENIAALYGDMDYVNIVLARGDASAEPCSSDSQLARWMGEYLDSVAGLKNKLTAKKSIQWIKPGAKAASSGFSLFGRK